MKKLIFYSIILLLLLGSCRDPIQPESTVQSITVENPNIEVEKLSTSLIKATVLPITVKDKRLTYGSEDPTIATVDSQGLVTGVNVGRTKIVIKSVNNPKIQATVDILVSAIIIPVEDIILPLDLNNKELTVGDTYTIPITILPSTASNKTVIYEYESDKDKIDIDSNNQITAKQVGDVTVVVKAQNNPSIQKTFTLKIKPQPTIQIDKNELNPSENEGFEDFDIKTLHGKSEYSIEIVCDEDPKWVLFVQCYSGDPEKDIIRLKVLSNKSVWSRQAFVHIKKNETIVHTITVKQKENYINPDVRIRWVYGIGEPTQTEKERGKIENPTPGQPKKFYWADDKIFYWYENDNTKWFNNRKLYPLNLVAGQYSDSAQCWAKTASNMLHWWFEQNKENIDRYIEKKNITGVRKDEYRDFYKRNSPDDEEPEKSYIAKTFRTKAHNSTNGDYIENGLVWYLYGRDNISRQKTYKGPALFTDVFENVIKDPDRSPIKTTIIQQDIDLFNRTLVNALNSKKAVGIVIYGTKDKKDYKHAITLWGAILDNKDRVVAIYVVDNNFGENRIFPYGIWYKDGRPYLFNYGGANDFVQDRYVGEIVTLDVGTEHFENWFRDN